MQRNPAILPDDLPKFTQSVEEAFLKMSARLASVKTVYYPCCFKDRQFEKLFKDANITYLDQNPDSFTQPIDPKNKTVIGDAHTYICEPPVDLVILLNPEIIPNTLSDCVGMFGYVLTNDYHKTARTLLQNSTFTLIGCEDLEKGWLSGEDAKRGITPVSSDEEWKTLRPDSYFRIERAQKLANTKYYEVFKEGLSIQNMIEWHRHITQIILENEKKIVSDKDEEFPDPRISEF